MPKLIVGLGNPGKQYENTVHNAGFIALDLLAGPPPTGIDAGAFKSSKFEALVASGATSPAAGSVGVVLAKPLTFMNESGRAVAKLFKFYKLAPEDLIVIHDDIDLEPGTLRTKLGGGDGGHNGLRSITSALGTPNYHRVRVGVGRGSADWGSKAAASHVLKPLTGKLLEAFRTDCALAADQALALL